LGVLLQYLEVSPMHPVKLNNVMSMYHLRISDFEPPPVVQLKVLHKYNVLFACSGCCFLFSDHYCAENFSGRKVVAHCFWWRKNTLSVCTMGSELLPSTNFRLINVSPSLLLQFRLHLTSSKYGYDDELYLLRAGTKSSLES
jgi:hypothetical protein